MFVGGFTLEAAEAVAGESGRNDAPSAQVLYGIAALLDKNLVRREPTSSSETRYSLLETIRAFAEEHLTANGEGVDLRHRHADYFLGFAKRNQIQPLVHFSPDQPERLAAEHANLDASLTWLFETGDHQQFVRLVASLGLFWWVHGYVREGLVWLEHASTVLIDVPQIDAATIATARGFIALHAGDYHLVHESLGHARTLWRTSDERLAEILVLSGLASMENSRGDCARATSWIDEAMVLAGAVPSADRAVARGIALMNLNISLMSQGDFVKAAALSEEVLHLLREAGFSHGELYVLTDLGNVYRELGDAARALDFYCQSLRLAVPYRQKLVTYAAIEGIALICGDLGEMEQTTRLLVAADRLRESSGVLQRTPHERSTFDQLFAAAQSVLGDRVFRDAWATGRTMTVSAAVADVFSLCVTDCYRSITASPSFRLTARERDILPLLVAGQTNRQIADSLYLGLRTVEGHISRLLTKLGVSTRTAAATAAVAAGLIDGEAPISSGEQ